MSHFVAKVFLHNIFLCKIEVTIDFSLDTRILSLGVLVVNMCLILNASRDLKIMLCWDNTSKDSIRRNYNRCGKLREPSLVSGTLKHGY